MDPMLGRRRWLAVPLLLAMASGCGGATSGPESTAPGRPKDIHAIRHVVVIM